MGELDVTRQESTECLTPEQLERYKLWFDNNRRLRQLTKELEAFSLQAAKPAEGWADQQPQQGR